MGNLYLDLREALDIVRESGKRFHFYDPKKDSLQAMIDHALSKRAKTG